MDDATKYIPPIYMLPSIDTDQLVFHYTHTLTHYIVGTY